MDSNVENMCECREYVRISMPISYSPLVQSKNERASVMLRRASLAFVLVIVASIVGLSRRRRRRFRSGSAFVIVVIFVVVSAILR